jgi:ubiquinol-cytochrome c reductase core subunit 2
MVEHEFHDQVLPRVQLDYDAVQTAPPTLALQALHATAFHRGLGSPILASPTTPINVHQIAEYSTLAYTKSNVAIVASGATAQELAPQIQEFWKDMPVGQPLNTPAVKFHGGETRISHKTNGHNVYALAFPGSALYGPSSSPEQIVLAHYLGGFPRMKWGTGHTALAKVNASLEDGTKLLATNIGYSDTGLFVLMAVGTPFKVAEGITQGLKSLRNIAKGTTPIKDEELKRAIASARYMTYASSEARLSGLEPIGQAVLDTGKVPTTDSVVSSYDNVTADKLKQVSVPPCLWDANGNRLPPRY